VVGPEGAADVWLGEGGREQAVFGGDGHDLLWLGGTSALPVGMGAQAVGRLFLAAFHAALACLPLCAACCCHSVQHLEL
jgi:hypothetical protein